MRISALCTAVLTCVVAGHPPPAAAQVDQQRAQEYFKEAQALCERDGGRLWGGRSARPWRSATRGRGRSSDTIRTAPRLRSLVTCLQRSALPPACLARSARRDAAGQRFDGTS
jgi:hypothetical protein